MRQASVVRHDAHWTTARGLHLHNKRTALTSSSRHQIFNPKQLKRVMTFCFWFYIEHLVELKRFDGRSILCILKQSRYLTWFCVFTFISCTSNFVHNSCKESCCSSNKMTRWIIYYNKKQLQLTSTECMLQLSKQCAFSYFLIQFTEFLTSLLVWRLIFKNISFKG